MMVLSRTVPPERAATAQALHSALGQGVPNGLMMLLTGFLYARVGGQVFLAMAVAGLALALGPCVGAAERRVRTATANGELEHGELTAAGVWR